MPCESDTRAHASRDIWQPHRSQWRSSDIPFPIIPLRTIPENAHEPSCQHEPCRCDDYSFARLQVPGRPRRFQTRVHAVEHTHNTRHQCRARRDGWCGWTRAHTHTHGRRRSAPNLQLCLYLKSREHLVRHQHGTAHTCPPNFVSHASRSALSFLKAASIRACCFVPLSGRLIA